MNELDELIKLAGELYGKLKAYKENLPKKEVKKEATTNKEDVVDLDELKSWF